MTSIPPSGTPDFALFKGVLEIHADLFNDESLPVHKVREIVDAYKETKDKEITKKLIDMVNEQNRCHTFEQTKKYKMEKIKLKLGHPPED